MYSLKGSDDTKVTRKGIAMFGRTTTANLTVATNGALSFGETTYFNNSNNISLLSATQFKLKANTLYLIEADVGANVTVTESTFSYQIYNVTTNATIGNLAMVESPKYTLADTALYSKAKAIISPTVDTIIEVRNVGTSVNYIYSGVNVVIEELEAYTTLVPDILDKQLGINQTWQNMTSLRTFGTTYTNTTGKPIEVVIGIDCITGTVGYIIPTINGVAGTNFGNNSTACSATSMNVSYIIPDGGTYLFTKTGTAITYYKWLELR